MTKEEIKQLAREIHKLQKKDEEKETRHSCNSFLDSESSSGLIYGPGGNVATNGGIF